MLICPSQHQTANSKLPFPKTLAANAFFSGLYSCYSLQILTNEQSTTLKSIKSLAPLLDRVLVQRIKAETKTASGIFLPESSVKELNEARVLAVGPGGLDKDGKRVQCSVQAGDKVLIPQVRDYLRDGRTERWYARHGGWCG